MSVYAMIPEFEQLFRDSSVQPTILNDLQVTSEEDRGMIGKLTRSTIINDEYSNLPTCDQGCTTGAPRLGKYCRTCGTKVAKPRDTRLEARVWFRSPKGCAKWVSPLIWNFLQDRYSRGNFSYINWLCKIDVRGQVLPHDMLEILLSRGVVRGYNSFIDNFQEYIELLEQLPVFEKSTEKSGLLMLLRTLTHGQIFSEYLPAPNKALILLEDNSAGRWIDALLGQVIDAMAMIQGIDTPNNLFSSLQRESRCAKTLNALSGYFYQVYHEVFASKTGAFRKDIFGNRMLYSTRAVISSATDPHDYDSVRIGWTQGIALFEDHLSNFLLKQGWSPSKIASHLRKHATKYCPLLDALFKKIFSLTRDGMGFYCIFVRNPTLGRGSTQLVRLIGVKTDPRDPTTELSILAVVAPNADFDGDAMMLCMLGDRLLSEMARNLRPHNNMLDPDTPGKLTNVASIPKPAATNNGNWLRARDRDVSQQTQAHREFLAMLAT